MKKLSKTLLFAISLLTLVFAGCKEKNASSAESKTSSTNNNQKVIRIIYQTGNLCGAPVHIAMKNGLFDEELGKIGQKAEYVLLNVAETSVGELVASKKADAGFGLYATQIPSLENGLPLVFVSGIHTGCTKYYVKKDSPINSIADLRGKKIGVPGLTDSSVMTMKRLLIKEKIGVTVDNAEVEFLQYSGSDLPIALDKGSVDVIGFHDPLATKAELAYGLKKIFDTGLDEQYKYDYCCQIFVTQDLINTNPEGAAAYVRAMQKASAFVEAEPVKAAEIQIVNDMVAGDLDFNAKLLEELNYVPSKANGRKTFVNAAFELQTAGVLKKETDVLKLVSDHYKTLDGVPESYTYDSKTGTYTEVN